MKATTIRTLIATLAIALSTSVAFAQDKGTMSGHDHSSHGAMNHTTTDHSTMSHDSKEHGGMVMGVGIIHSVSKLNRMVNITHEPIPALNWPEMTMDLPVAKSVDLGTITTGEKVSFHLELDADQKYVITEILK